MFEQEVLAELVLNIAEPLGPAGDPVVVRIQRIANIMYSYEVIKLAAAAVQARPSWLGVKRVEALKFSSRWCASFLRRTAYVKRSVTAKNRAGIRPTVDIIQVCQCWHHGDSKSLFVTTVP